MDLVGPLVLILMGPPGAGKGTHAGPLSERLGLPHISTGDLFRENIRNQTSFGKSAKEHIDQGRLVPDELVIEMLFERIGRADCRQGFILDGFPRTTAQAKALESRLGDSVELIALNLNIEDSVLIDRISGRIGCKECGRPYHKRFDPPKEVGICDRCHSPLYQREDDRPEIVSKRLEIYRIQTQPLIEYYSSKDSGLRQIDSNQPKEIVLQELLEQIPFEVSRR